MYSIENKKHYPPFQSKVKYSKNTERQNHSNNNYKVHVELNHFI
ncbi:hypothetical protein L282_0136 [Escherichia coli APEC IMT5155]|nr:hypothetical protein L282_0136 [Escherichia coli APEC IMT5155]